MRRLVRVAAVGVLGLLGVPAGTVAPGCSSNDKQYSQTELNALETREFLYAFDPTFDATVGTVFDLGCVIRTSDKRGGLLVASGPGGSVQIKLDQAGPNRTSVRISPIQGGQARVNKERIDQFFNRIDQRLIAGPAKAGKPG